MTLAVAFRCPKGGVLLCSDQEWNDAGISKKQINKNYRIGEFAPCDFFISGSGPSTVILNTWRALHKCLKRAAQDGKDVLADHQVLLESVLMAVHQKYAEKLKYDPISLLIIVAPRSVGEYPLLYWTDDESLVSGDDYYAVGSGRPIADYFAERLYRNRRFDKRSLATLAAFILREAGESSPGIGPGANMVFIHEGEKVMHYIGPGVIKEIQDGIPSLSDAINSYWPEHVKFTEWYAT